MAKKQRKSKGTQDAPALGFVGTLRWIWTQLTSMPTALFLLLLLAVLCCTGIDFPAASLGARKRRRLH